MTIEPDPTIVARAVSNANNRWQELAEWIPTWMTPDEAEHVGSLLEDSHRQRELAATISERFLALARKDGHHPDGTEVFDGWFIVRAIQHYASGTLVDSRVEAHEINGRLQLCIGCEPVEDAA